MENEMTAAAVAGCLAHAARQRGGVLLGTAAELHKLGSGELWPRSALELERVQLPDLARRAGHAGCTVQPMGGAARGVWHVMAAPLPQAVPKPQPRPVAATAPAAPPKRPQSGRIAAGAYIGAAAGLPIPSQAEFERVAAAGKAAQAGRFAERKAAIESEKLAIAHAQNLRLLRGAA
jgi:hypothetical protein